MTPGGIPMPSYIDSLHFPQVSARTVHSRTISDHFRILGNLLVSYLDLFSDKYMCQLSADTDMVQPGG